MTDKQIETFIKAMGKIYKNDIIEFSKDILGIKSLNEQQVEYLKSFVDFKEVIVGSGHETGKTFCNAVITMFWLCTNFNSRVVVLAPSWNQLKNIYFSELIKLYNNSKVKGIGLFEYSSEVFKSCHSELKTNYRVLMNAPKETSTLQGYHSKKDDIIDKFIADRGLNPFDMITDKETLEELKEFMHNKNDTDSNAEGLLIVADEGSGIKEEFYDVLLGASPTKFVCTGNVIYNTGRFYNMLYKNPHKSKKVLHLDSRKSHLFNPEQCEKIIREFGEDSNVFRVRVTGHAPNSNVNALFDINKIRERIGIKGTKYNGFLLAGLDVAGKGDDSVEMFTDDGISIRNEFTLKGETHIRDITGRVEQWCKDYPDETKYLSIDSTGMGQFAYDELFALIDEDYYLSNDNKRFPNLEIFEVNFASNKCWKTKTYFNVATELWFFGKEQLGSSHIEDGEHIDTLLEELSARYYKIRSNGLLWIEPKEEFKKRLGRSPDKADAFLLCLYSRHLVEI